MEEKQDLSAEMASAGYKPLVSEAQAPIEAGGGLSEEMSKAGYKPLAQQGGLSDSPIVSAAAGINAGVEDVTYGTLQLAGQITDKIFGTNLNQKVVAARTPHLAEQEAYMAKNPTTGTVARVGGTVGSTLALGGIGGAGAKGGLLYTASQGLIQGSIMGALLYDEDSTLVDKVKNAAIGGAIGGGLGVALGAATNVAKGFMTGREGAASFIDDVTTGVKNKINAVDPDISASKIMSTIDDKFKDVTAIKNANYAARDKAALESGIKISTPSVNTAIKDITEELGTRISSEEKTLLKSISSFGGDKPVTIGESYNLLKRVGNLRQSASVTDPNKARLLGRVQDAITSDIDNGVQISGNRVVQELHDTAQTFYQSTYIPIKEVAKAKAVEKLTSEAFVERLVKDASVKQYASSGLTTLGDDIRKGVMGAHMNAVKQAVTDPFAGTIDLKIYSNVLQKDLIKNPAFHDIAKTIGGLSEVVSTLGGVASNRGLGIAGGALTGVAAVTGNPVLAGLAASGFTVGKVIAWHGLGKLLSNPQVTSLLQSVTKPNIAAPVKQEIIKRVGNAIGATFGSSSTQQLAQRAIIGSALPIKKTSPQYNYEAPKQEESVPTGIRG